MRKITAVSAAETSASASPARTTSAPWGRRPPSATRGRTARTNAGRASSTSGACTRKIARQPRTWVMAPPSAGPVAVPSSVAARHCGPPSAAPSASSANAAASIAAPPAA